VRRGTSIHQPASQEDEDGRRHHGEPGRVGGGRVARRATRPCGSLDTLRWLVVVDHSPRRARPATDRSDRTDRPDAPASSTLDSAPPEADDARSSSAMTLSLSVLGLRGS
jgi:hypothetical protein